MPKDLVLRLVLALAIALPLALWQASAAVADEATSAEGLQPTTCTLEDQAYNEESRARDADAVADA